MWELKNSKQVEKNEHIRFRCTRCAACCRHVKESVVIEGLDAYRLARHLGMETADFMSQYTEPFILDDKLWYPIFSLRVKGNEDSCIFLKGTRCTVQEAKPRTCRLYPFWVEPNEPDGTDFTYHICFEHQHHPKGSLVRVKDLLSYANDGENNTYLYYEPSYPWEREEEEFRTEEEAKEYISSIVMPFVGDQVTRKDILALIGEICEVGCG